MRNQDILRALARRYMDAARDPVSDERRERGYQTNSLHPARPLVWVDEVPWHEMNLDDELTLRCEGEDARGMETFFRRKLYQWDHFQGDMVLEPRYRIFFSIQSTGLGLHIAEQTLATDRKNNIVSHAYIDQLDEIGKVNALRIPVITRDREEDERRLSFARDMLGDVMPVELQGTMFYYTPWDDIATLRGMTPMLLDVMDNPELMHATIARFAAIKAAEADQMEALGLFTSRPESLHCTPPYSSELERIEETEGNSARCAWFRATAQPFGQVSPALHDELEIQYLLPIAARFGLTYYGCCEPLSDRLDIVKKIPNLRKVGVSPWSNVEISAEQLGGDYVFARKPNPALVAGTLDEDAVRRETRQTVEMCRKYRCPYELVLKDISTVGNKPQTLFRWMRIVQETIDQYY